MQINIRAHHGKIEAVVGRPLSTDEAIAALLDMETNIAVGHLVYLANGGTFAAWSCAP